MDKVVYLIDSISEFGKLLAYCINNDISVWRSYWDEREKGNRVYHVDFIDNRLYYSSVDFYQREGFSVVKPVFYFDKFGNVKIK